MLGRVRLRGTDGIRCRKSVDQPGFQPCMHLRVGPRRFARIGRMLVVRRRIEFLSHASFPLEAGNAPRLMAVPRLAKTSAAVYQEPILSRQEPDRVTPKIAANPVLDVLSGRRQAVPPIWMMRQAGRYLRISRRARPGRRLSRSLLHAGIGGG